MRQQLTGVALRLERQLTGPLPAAVRPNVRIELGAMVAYGAFFAVVYFLPVVLRNLGAGIELLALYTAQTYLGSVLALFSVRLLRGRDPRRFTVVCWSIARGLFLLAALASEAGWLLVLTALFWLFEAFPAPAYARIVQAIYPTPYRGRALGVVRTGMVLALLVATPLTGWALDALGHRVVLPVAGALGLCAAAIFARLRVEVAPLAPDGGARGGAWRILLEDRRFATYLLGFSLYGIGFLASFPFFAVVQVDRLQLSYSAVGLLGLVQSLFWLLGNLYWGRLIDRRGGPWVLRACVGLAVIIPLSYLAASNGLMLLPAFIVLGIISAGVDLGLISTGISLAPPERVAEYSALQATVIGVRGMLGPLIGTALVGLGLPLGAIFALGAATIAAGWVVLGGIAAAGVEGRPAEQG